MTRPGRRGYLDDILDELHRRNNETSVAYLALTLGIPSAKVVNALASFVKRNPKGNVVRVKTGVYRWVDSPKVAVKRVLTRTLVAAAKNEVDEKIVSPGWIPPSEAITALASSAQLDIEDMRINRGGIRFPAPRTTGMNMIVSFMHEAGDEMYFVLDGKMWKATQV